MEIANRYCLISATVQTIKSNAEKIRQVSKIHQLIFGIKLIEPLISFNGKIFMFMD